MSILHWFRRDLRLVDNAALHAAWQESGGHVIPAFVLSSWKGQRAWISPARQSVLCSSLNELAANLKNKGSRLILRRGDPVKELERLLRETRADALFYNKSPDPSGRALEQRVDAMASGLDVRVQSFHDVTVHPPEAVLTQSGEPFRIFTPYSRAWIRQSIPSPLPAPEHFHHIPLLSGLKSLSLPKLSDWGITSSVRQRASGETAARRRMEAFFRDPVFRYAAERDFPSADATSHLSVDLRWGTVSPRVLVHQCRDAMDTAKTSADRESARKFLSELIWREFYMAILWHWPEVLELEFQSRFRGMRWDYAEEAFQRWCDGLTGFPIVDAGMRQLAATGWMHNRVRMIVAMFLTKDLHIDWRLGERFFMERLADGEIASNNGGWQWSAGTGADAAPYFRIQNPWTQSTRYDPDGEYIRTWVPELRDLPAELFHRPPKAGARLASGYPEPMVEHSSEREWTLNVYGKMTKDFKSSKKKTVQTLESKLRN